MKLIHLLYKSLSHGELSAAQVEKILQASRANNERDNITGLLLYKNGTFVQLLEGREDVVQNCYDRIVKDKRHYAPSTILRVEEDRRLFPSWSMGHIKQDRITKPFDTLEAVTAAMAGKQAVNCDTILKVIKDFVTGPLEETKK